jgi:DNA-binding Lrp family transcriptional regulator
VTRQQPLGIDASPPIDEVDRRIILATQEGLPLCARPFDQLAGELAMPAAEILQRMREMLRRGVIRRIAAVPNHYELGYRVNGMSVWDVADDRIDELGPRIGALDFVSHCYHRPRHPPRWPYNLFAMLHGRSRPQVEQGISQIAEILGEAARARTVLFSTRILKKAGLRLED